MAIFNIGGKYDRNDDELIGGKWGLVDISGKELIPPRYDELENFHDGLALVKLNGKYGFIDIRGKVVIPTIYDSLGIFFSDEGATEFEINGKWGLINRQGIVIVPPRYSSLFGPHDGLASVTLNGKWGYLDMNGEEYWVDDLEEAKRLSRKWKPKKK